MRGGLSFEDTYRYPGTPLGTPYFRGVSAYLAEPSGVKVALVLIGNWEVNYTR